MGRHSALWLCATIGCVVAIGNCASPPPPASQPPAAAAPSQPAAAAASAPTASATTPSTLPSASGVTPPRAPDLPSIEGKPVEVVPGDTYTCVLVDTGKVYCWGSSDDGALGLGSSARSAAKPTVVPGVSDVAHITGGPTWVCASLRQGTLQCWGDAWHVVGTNPSPGDGPVANRKVQDITQMSSTDGELAALLKGGQVMMWESTASLQQWGTQGLKPPKGFCAGCKLAGLSGVTQISSGLTGHCALLGDGTARCWGGNQYGQLGNGTVSADPYAPPTREPKPVVQLQDAAEVAVSDHACARHKDGSVSCWGGNQYGQLGDGTVQSSPRPKKTPGLSGVVQIAVSDGFSCARHQDGKVQCWGDNGNGQLGDGTKAGSKLPKPIDALQGASRLFLGVRRSCAIRPDGQVHCWGWDKKTSKTIPVQRVL